VCRDKATEALAQFISHPTKDHQAGLLIACRGGRIFNAPVGERGLPWKDGTALPGGVADGDDVVEVLADKFLHGLRALPRNIDAQLPPHRDGFRTHPAGLSASARHVKAIMAVVSQQPFGYLAPGGVGRTQN